MASQPRGWSAYILLLSGLVLLDAAAYLGGGWEGLQGFLTVELFVGGIVAAAFGFMGLMGLM